MRSETNLTISGSVQKFVTITPKIVRFNGKTGEELKSVVQIVPESKFQFSVLKIRTADGKNLKCELKEKGSASGSKEYLVMVENLKQDAGSYYDVIILETDSNIQPFIKINVMAKITDSNDQKKADSSEVSKS